MDVDERATSLSRSKGERAGAAIDLQVIEKHRGYLDLPEHREFVDSYLVTIYAGFLKAGDRSAARRIYAELRRRGALNFGVLRQYLRHAPEFRAAKSLLRYDSIRRMATRFAKARPS
jgi:hypothetical protein